MRNQKPHQFDASKIIRAYTKITLKEAMEMASDNIKPNIHVSRKSYVSNSNSTLEQFESVHIRPNICSTFIRISKFTEIL